jgi:hypothetical protein
MKWASHAKDVSRKRTYLDSRFGSRPCENSTGRQGRNAPTGSASVALSLPIVKRTIRCRKGLSTRHCRTAPIADTIFSFTTEAVEKRDF